MCECILCSFLSYGTITHIKHTERLIAGTLDLYQFFVQKV